MSGLFTVDGILNPSGHGLPASVHLQKPWGYVLLSPVSALLDGVTCLSARQHIVLLITSIATFALGRVSRRPMKSMREIINWGLFLGVYAIVYLSCLFLPRPATRLYSSDPDHVIIDFHSHTKYSHDGSIFFTPEKNRQWHSEMGFQVAYITDHNTLVGAREGMSRNPSFAGEGTVLLPGIELSCYRQHIILLGVHGEVDNRPYTADYNVVRFLLRRFSGDGDTVTILSLPSYSRESWEQVGSFIEAGTDGFEIAKADPISLDFTKNHRDKIINIAKRLDLPLLAVTDNHGYGAASAAWTVMSIPGWRSLSPDQLNREIITRLKREGFAATVPVVRDLAYPADSWKTPLIGFALPIDILRSLTIAERFVWMAWALAMAFIIRLVRVNLSCRTSEGHLTTVAITFK